MAVYRNGQHQGVYVLTEYLGSDYLEARFGHDQFVLVRTKLNPNARAPRVSL